MPLETLDLGGGSDLYSTPAPAPVVSAAAAADKDVAIERRPVPDNDDDKATAETVRMMCDYIAAGVADPACRAWAAEALNRYAGKSADPRARFWGVFWLLKHCVKFRSDEPELFRMGEKDGRDLLVAPAVLVRQDAPAEDCDGFTMLACTLLRILGIEPVIVTVKADPRNPDRWSHVFAIADLPGLGVCAMDASHGAFPGWMVPSAHTFGVQAWNMQGQPIVHSLPKVSRLAGYVRRGRGLGDCPIDPLTGDTIVCDFPNMDPVSGGGGGGINWGSILNNLISTAGKVATVAEAPAGSVITPSQGLIAGGGAPGAGLTTTLTATNIWPWIIGGAFLFGIVALGGRKH